MIPSSVFAAAATNGCCAVPLVSIITPTKDRQHLLPALLQCVRAQSFTEIEWLIHDGSPQSDSMLGSLNDPRIKYMHVARSMSIGAKRNYLCRVAQGKIIAHFDDDDFYGQNYIRDMVSFMTDQKAHFVKLSGFFLYHRPYNVFAYWDLERDFPLHFHLAPNDPVYAQPNNGKMSGKWGYGFSYVFSRMVWESIHFPDQNHNEDLPFARHAVANFRAVAKQDYDRNCLHVIHTNNISTTFPQQLLPPERLKHLFPHFKG